MLISEMWRKHCQFFYFKREVSPAIFHLLTSFRVLIVSIIYGNFYFNLYIDELTEAIITPNKAFFLASFISHLGIL